MSHPSMPSVDCENAKPVAEVTDFDDNSDSTELHKRSYKSFLWWLLPVSLLAGGALLWLILRGDSSSELGGATGGFGRATAIAKESRVEDSTGFVGQLEAQQGTVLQAKTEGRVTQIFVLSGDQVAEGDPIVQLSPERVAG